jgi:hypothetical protein
MQDKTLVKWILSTTIIATLLCATRNGAKRDGCLSTCSRDPARQRQ